MPPRGQPHRGETGSWELCEGVCPTVASARGLHSQGGGHVHWLVAAVPGSRIWDAQGSVKTPVHSLQLLAALRRGAEPASGVHLLVVPPGLERVTALVAAAVSPWSGGSPRPQSGGHGVRDHRGHSRHVNRTLAVLQVSRRRGPGPVPCNVPGSPLPTLI